MKSDQQLQHDMLAELEWDPSVEATQIGVSVVEGIATLSGEVSSFAEKWSVEHAAQQVAGVQSLVIKIDVNLPSLHERSDIDIARAAENVLRWMSYAADDRIKVLVENGWITLTGELQWEHQRQAAQLALRHLFGVRGISDQMSITNHSKFNSHLTPNVSGQDAVSSANVKNSIAGALNRRAKLNAESISVEVDGNHVTLHGEVSSWAERELAKQSAWGTPGVMRVTDKLIAAQ